MISRSFYLIFCGICMGVADLCPGISGGTIAYIMGFYQDFLVSIKSIRFKNLTSNPSFWFLLKIVSGIFISVSLLAPFLDQVLNKEVERTYLYALFLGLILGSIVLAFKEIEKMNRWTVLALFFGLFFGFTLTSLDLKPINNENLYDVHFSYQSNKNLINYNSEKEILENVPESTLIAMKLKGLLPKKTHLYDKNENKLVKLESLVGKNKSFWVVDGWIIFCGSMAVCALLLPGISGSYILTILGSYGTVISALAEFIQSLQTGFFDFDAFFILISLSVGIVGGAFLFSRVVLWLLKSYKSLTQAIMLGIMIGALPTVWPFWSYSYQLEPLKLAKGPILNPVSPFLPSLSLTFGISFLLLIFGFSLVLIVNALSRKKLITQKTI